MKPQLLIIPGWEGSRLSWEKFINLAKNDFDIFCFDLPCFGNEPCPNKVWGVEEYANFIRQKMAEHNIVKPVLLGHSFGGQIAAFLAANYPAEFSKLILSGAAVFRRAPTIKKIIFNSLAKAGHFLNHIFLADHGSAYFKKILYRLANSDYNQTSGMKREIYKKITNQDLSEILPKINLPALVVWGKRDRYVPLRQGRKIAAAIPGARLEIIRHAGHGLHLKTLDAFYKIIKSFSI